MYIYGKNVAIEAIKNKQKIKKIYLAKNFKDMDILNDVDCRIIYKEKYELDHMIDGLHQGIVLEVEDFKYSDIDELIDKEFVVMLDHLEDPHNFGAIIRSCEASGVDGIIIPKDRSVEVNGTVMKTSVGTLEKMKIVKVTNLVQTINYLKKNNFWIIGTDMEGTDYRKLDYNGKICIIIGNEGSGISRLVKENCDFIASIPMKGEINSLNASVATGIVLFEANKGR